MVCVDKKVKVECVIQDNDSNKFESYSITLPASTTIDELYREVSEIHKREPDSFELTYIPIQANNMVELTNLRNMTLLELEPNCSNDMMTIVIREKDQPPKHISLPSPIMSSFEIDEFKVRIREDRRSIQNSIISFPDSQSTKVDSTRPLRVVFGNSKSIQILVPDAPSIDQTDISISNQPEQNYVGLVNQAMTCYLNSLLQALYMTPEFRNALYNWEYVDGSENNEACSIPYQLQKLFLNLQTSTEPAVETTSLTKSFGWDSTEAWQQHDIQELCRVMFDALETKFKDTEQADLINRLYEGKMIDYVKCLECKTEKSREDTFLDIPLPVRPFESTVAYGSVEEALRAFVKYETLEGINQYHCEKCNKKCDAHKGLKFSKFPYLLTLHLKRFDFDYNTLYRIKLNDKVTFPHNLDLNSFIETTPIQESFSGEEDAGMSIKCDDSTTTDSRTSEDECPPCDSAISSHNHSNNHEQDDDEGIDMSNGHSTTNGIAHDHENEKNHEKSLTGRGPYMYELFSIMIHSGSASGGHYYAYIKDFKTKQWLCFNDSTVNPITDNDIQKVYGGGPTRAYSSSTNAYMLMYRQIDPSKNALPMQEENFPQHIKTLLKKIKETEDCDRRYHGKLALSYKIKIYCYHPKTKKLITNKLHTIGESTWAELTEKAYDKFGLHGDVDLDQCRLVFYEHTCDLITHNYEGSDEDLISDIFKICYDWDLFLEIREKDQQFETYKSDGVATKVYVIDVPRADIIDGPIKVRGYLSQTVREFKQQLTKIVKIDPAEMKLVMRMLSQNHLLQDDKTLNAVGLDVLSIHTLYVTSTFDTDIMKPSKRSNKEIESSNSKLFSVIDSFENVIPLSIQLPTVNKEFLEELMTPSLENASKEESTRSPSDGPVEITVNDASENCHYRGVKKMTYKSNAISSKCSRIYNSSETTLDDKSKINECSENNCIKWKTGLESTSEDSSLSDSEKTLIDDSFDSSKKKKIDRYYNLHVNSDSDEESNYYFKATPFSSEKNENLLKVLVDGRMCLETLKKKLEKFVGVAADYFNIYSHPDDVPEMEFTDLRATLILFNHGERIYIKLGRALRKGELKVKLYQLHLDCPEEPFKFIFDWIVSKDMTVAQAKEEIIAELKQKYDLEIPFKRLRLRKKTMKSASTVLLDQSKFEDLTLHHSNKLIVQELSENETVTEPKQLVLFVRRWFRSNLQLGPFQEVVLDGRTISELKEKINLLSGIPEENIDIAKGKGCFPSDNINLLNMETELDWKEKSKDVDQWPLSLEDGSVVFYRDSKEIVKQLSSEEKREFTNKENSRLYGLGTTPSYSSPRRERALKIHLDSK